MKPTDPRRPLSRAWLAASAVGLALAGCNASESSQGGPSAGASAIAPDAGMDAATSTPVLPLAGRPAPSPFVRPPMLDAGPMTTPDATLDAGPAASLGARCVSDHDCTAPLTCLEVNEDTGKGEGPPRGLCTLKCEPDSTACADLGGVCLDVTYAGVGAESTYCMETCSFGPGDQTQFTDSKCHAREEFACYGLTSGPTCVANCNADGDCGTRICNPGTGLCGNTTPPGDGIGVKCDPAASPDTCRGYCQSFTLSDGGTTGTCMEDCTFGRVATCGWTGTGPANAACYLFPSSVLDAGGPGYGDVGNCVQLCDCNKDCLNPAFVCEPLGSADLEMYWGRKGLCNVKGTLGDIPTCPVTM